MRGVLCSAAAVTDELMRRGELWQPAPGLVALRGEVARLRDVVAAALRELCAAEGGEEWHLPPALPFATLEQADYFASFPQWLTAASHFSDPAGLAAIAEAREPATAALATLRPAPIALQPAVCYHVYAALSGRVVSGTQRISAGGTCWRHEAGRFAPLERGWSFTMQEAVRAGTAEEVRESCEWYRVAAQRFAERLGLRPRIAAATDPFFAAGSRGRALLQRLRSLKHELLLPLGDGRRVAAASFNDHARFFGDAFGIRLPDGTPATTGCAAFGVERWVLAVLVEHGTDARDWPTILESPQTRAATPAQAR